PMPRPPPEAPLSALARFGSGRLSMWLAGAVCGIEPVTSLREEDEYGREGPKPSLKRPESALQLATAIPIKEMATSCGQGADRRAAHMVTRSNAIQGQANKQRWGKQAFKCRADLFYGALSVFAVTVRAPDPAKAAQSARQ
ncbi:MAG: hypothetical protein WBG15_09045, partial [Xanthobacteraceae bacterium]